MRLLVPLTLHRRVCTSACVPVAPVRDWRAQRGVKMAKDSNVQQVMVEQGLQLRFSLTFFCSFSL